MASGTGVVLLDQPAIVMREVVGTIRAGSINALRLIYMERLVPGSGRCLLKDRLGYPTNHCEDEC